MPSENEFFKAIRTRFGRADVTTRRKSHSEGLMSTISESISHISYHLTWESETSFPTLQFRPQEWLQMILSLVQSFPEEAKKLHVQLEKKYKERYEGYKEMAEG